MICDDAALYCFLEYQWGLKVWVKTFVCCGHSLGGSGVERKAEILGNERCSRGKVNFHFCRPFWFVCSVVLVGIGHHLITAFYNQSPFSFYPGVVSFPKAPPPLVLRHLASLSSSSRSAVWCLTLESEKGFACGRLIASEIPVLMELILLLWSLCSAFELVSRVIVWGCINWLASKLCVLLSLWWILHLELREMLVKHKTTTKDMPRKRYTCTHITCVRLIWNFIPFTVNSIYWTISLYSLRLWWRNLSPFPLPQASEAHIRIGRIYYHFIFPPQLFRVSSIAGPVWDLISLSFAFVEQQFK